MKFVGIVLVALGLYIGYMGVSKLSTSTTQVEYLGLQMDTKSEKVTTKGIIFIFGAIAFVTGGVYVMRNEQRA